MSETYFITGIGTEVGKTVVSAIVTQALGADYWKPIQAGDLDHSDTHKVRNWVSNNECTFHPNAFNLNTPMSPHAAADIDGVRISAKKIKRPKTKNDLVIEGAGGLLVPLNNSETILDLIQPTDNVILVSRHYLGSINHTLLSVEVLRQRKLNILGIVFNGDPHPTTEDVIKEMTGLPVLGHVHNEPYIDSRVVEEYAAEFRESILNNK